METERKITRLKPFSGLTLVFALALTVSACRNTQDRRRVNRVVTSNPADGTQTPVERGRDTSNPQNTPGNQPGTSQDNTPTGPLTLEELVQKCREGNQNYAQHCSAVGVWVQDTNRNWIVLRNSIFDENDLCNVYADDPADHDGDGISDKCEDYLSPNGNSLKRPDDQTRPITEFAGLDKNHFNGWHVAATDLDWTSSERKSIRAWMGGRDDDKRVRKTYFPSGRLGQGNLELIDRFLSFGNSKNISAMAGLNMLFNHGSIVPGMGSRRIAIDTNMIAESGGRMGNISTFHGQYGIALAKGHRTRKVEGEVDKIFVIDSEPQGGQSEPTVTLETFDAAKYEEYSETEGIPYREHLLPQDSQHATSLMTGLIENFDTSRSKEAGPVMYVAQAKLFLHKNEIGPKGARLHLIDLKAHHTVQPYLAVFLVNGQIIGITGKGFKDKAFARFNRDIPTTGVSIHGDGVCGHSLAVVIITKKGFLRSDVKKLIGTNFAISGLKHEQIKGWEPASRNSIEIAVPIPAYMINQKYTNRCSFQMDRDILPIQDVAHEGNFLARLRQNKPIDGNGAEKIIFDALRSSGIEIGDAAEVLASEGGSREELDAGGTGDLSSNAQPSQVQVLGSQATQVPGMVVVTQVAGLSGANSAGGSPSAGGSAESAEQGNVTDNVEQIETAITSASGQMVYLSQGAMDLMLSDVFPALEAASGSPPTPSVDFGSLKGRLEALEIDSQAQAFLVPGPDATEVGRAFDDYLEVQFQQAPSDIYQSQVEALSQAFQGDPNTDLAKALKANAATFNQKVQDIRSAFADLRQNLTVDRGTTPVEENLADALLDLRLQAALSRVDVASKMHRAAGNTFQMYQTALTKLNTELTTALNSDPIVEIRQRSQAFVYPRQSNGGHYLFSSDAKTGDQPDSDKDAHFLYSLPCTYARGASTPNTLCAIMMAGLAAEIGRLYIEREGGLRFAIHGHASSIGGFDSNADLSKKRADKAKDGMVEIVQGLIDVHNQANQGAGIPSLTKNRVLTKGYGEAYPVNFLHQHIWCDPNATGASVESEECDVAARTSDTDGTEAINSRVKSNRTDDVLGNHTFTTTLNLGNTNPQMENRYASQRIVFELWIPGKKGTVMFEQD